MAIPSLTASAEILGVGTTLGVSELPLADPAVYVTIAKISDFTPPKKSRAKVKTTNFDDTDRLEKSISGFSSVADPSITLRFQKAIAQFLDDTYEAGTVYGWLITYPDGSKQPFVGYISELGIASPLEDVMTQMVSFNITDSVADFTAGS